MSNAPYCEKCKHWHYPQDAHVELFNSLVSDIIREAGAGACEVSAQAKHNSLMRILKMGQERGFNILGEREVKS